MTGAFKKKTLNKPEYTMAKIYVDDVPVGVKELYAVLGIDPRVIPSKLERIFEMNPDRIRKDEFGNERTPRRLGVSTKFNAYSPEKGRTVTIRYAKEAVPNNKNGYVVTNYAPAQLWINGKEEYVSDDLIYLYMYIHPDCFQSPFRKIDGGYRYLFKDNEALAKADLLRDEQEIRAMSMIIGESALSITQLRQIAKGMNIPGVDALTDAEVKNRLKKLAKDNPNKFFDDARSNSIVFNGLLQDAVDQKVITLISNNGYKRWYFNNNELCIIPAGADEMQVLKDAVIKNMDLIPQIKTALDGRSVSSELDKPENQKYFESFKTSTDITKQQVSPNLAKENKEVNDLSAFEAEIKALAEEEEADLKGISTMHYKRKEKLVKFREEVDAYKASLQPVQ